jgi:hypothetical protein
MRRLVEIGAFVIVTLFLAAVFLPDLLYVVPNVDATDSSSDLERPERADGSVGSDERHATDLASRSLRRHVLARGRDETGAENLVTAIYLGYRAFDTFGETVVLLLAVSGVLFLVKDRA